MQDLIERLLALAKNSLARRVVATLVVVAVGLLGIQVVDDDGDGRPDKLTIPLQGVEQVPAGVPNGAEQVTLDENEQEILDDIEGELGGHSEARLNDETPAELPPLARRELPRYFERNAESNTLPDLSPLAAPQQRGCASKFVGNQQSRGGVTPRAIMAHYAVTRDRDGILDAMTALANRRESQVSWHYAQRPGGDCVYNVPETAAAWTIAAANRYTINIEHTVFGDEPDIANSHGWPKVGRLYSDIARRWDIPLRRAVIDKNTCVPIRSGIGEHKDAGDCGGGHLDICKTPCSTSTPRSAQGFHVEKIIRAARLWRRLEARRRAHRRTHSRYRDLKCKKTMHKRRPAALNRQQCRDVKLRGKRQHAGIRHTTRTLRSL